MSVELRRGDPNPPGESRFWYGPDVLAGLYSVVPAGETVLVPILVPKSAFTSYSDVVSQLALPENKRQLKVDTRSRLAQLGLEVQQNVVTHLASQFLAMGEQAVEDSSFIPSYTYVTNFGPRSLVLPQNTEFFELYRTGEYIVGEDLMKAMGKDIVINGKEGVDWKYVYKDQFSRNPKDITGIAVRIEEGERYKISNRLKKGQKPEINLSKITGASDYRTAIREYYDRLQRNETVRIWFGTLPQLVLSNRVAVELDETVYSSLSSPNGVDPTELDGRSPRHIGARLLHPGSGITRKADEDGQHSIKVEIDMRDSVQEPGYVVFRPMWSLGYPSRFEAAA